MDTGNLRTLRASSLVWDGLRAFAAQYPYHPVRTYLESLVWDGQPRLERGSLPTALSKTTLQSGGGAAHAHRRSGAGDGAGL